MASNQIEVTPRQRRSSMEAPRIMFKEQRIVLFGSRGSAQFIVSNCILGRQVFTPDKWSLLQSVKNHVGVEGRKLSVINTPNFCEKDLTQSHIKKELKRCVCLSSPGPHAVLLVLDLEDISPADIRIVKELTAYFGDDILNYTILLLCHEGKEDDPNLEDRVQKDINLGQIMDKCRHRYHLFQKNSVGATTLLERIDRLVAKNGDQSFSNNNYKKTKDSIRQEETFIKKGREKEIKKRLHELDSMYQGEELERERDQYRQSVEADIREKAEAVILDRLGFAPRAVDYAAAVGKGIAIGVLGGAVLGQMGIIVGGAIGAVLGVVVAGGLLRYIRGVATDIVGD